MSKTKTRYERERNEDGRGTYIDEMHRLSRLVPSLNALQQSRERRKAGEDAGNPALGTEFETIALMLDCSGSEGKISRATPTKPAYSQRV
jgi:hypothetical protein